MLRVWIAFSDLDFSWFGGVFATEEAGKEYHADILESFQVVFKLYKVIE
tara:strand:- start:100 stop:246 length:147 start_codon:yes stop_codon:yes gene_type:complete